MNRRNLAFAALVVAACASPNRRTEDKLDLVLRRLQSLEERVTRLAATNERLNGMLTAALGGGTGAGAPADDEEEQRPRMPDPATVFSVPIEGDAVRGPATAKVTIVEGAEFACPFCLRAQSTLAELEEKYGKDLRFVWKNFIIHPEYATQAALAGCAAQKQGKFWQMEQAIWEAVWDAEKLEPRDASSLEKEGLEKLAGKLKLDKRRFAADMAGDECEQLIKRQEDQLTRVGTRGTPSFYVNGRHLSGAQPREVFEKVIDEEIAKADAAYKKGIKPERYYETIVANGVKVFE